MGATDDTPYARRAAELLRRDSRDVVSPILPPLPREKNDTIHSIAQSLRRRRHYALARGVGAFAALVIAASAVAILFAP